MAKRKTLFDDRPVEISELTYIIRQDIASLNSQIAQLQAYIKSSKGGKGGSAASGSKGKGNGGKQEEEHNSNVVMLLQSRLANMGMGFKDVLELRTQNMKASKDRTEQFMHTAQGSSVLAPAESESLLPSYPLSADHRLLDSLLFNQPGDRKGKSRANTPTPNPSSSLSNLGSKRGEKEGQDFLALDIDGDRGESGIGMGGDYQQMQLVEQQVGFFFSFSLESCETPSHACAITPPTKSTPDRCFVHSLTLARL